MFRDSAGSSDTSLAQSTSNATPAMFTGSTRSESTVPAQFAPALAGSEQVRAEGPLTVYSAAVPAGATAQVKAVANSAGDTIVTLHVRGLEPRTAYGAHAHVNACGLDGAAAGPHFQNVVDPASPSVDPAYANPVNEIWLDLTTNAWVTPNNKHVMVSAGTRPLTIPTAIDTFACLKMTTA